MKLTFIVDPGHGWLEVPEALLVSLGIAHQISSYSYRKGDKVYLEEDCDAPKFLVACKARGIPVETSEHYCHGSAFVRRLPDYEAPPAPAAPPLFTTLAANCIAQKQAGLFDPEPGEFALAAQ